LWHISKNSFLTKIFLYNLFLSNSQKFNYPYWLAHYTNNSMGILNTFYLNILVSFKSSKSQLIFLRSPKHFNISKQKLRWYNSYLNFIFKPKVLITQKNSYIINHKLWTYFTYNTYTHPLLVPMRMKIRLRYKFYF